MTCVRLLGVAWPVCNMFDVHKIETKVPCQIAHLPSTAVDMMRPWNCFGMSLCILYWTWFGQFDSVFSPVVMFGHALVAAVSVITFVFSA